MLEQETLPYTNKYIHTHTWAGGRARTHATSRYIEENNTKYVILEKQTVEIKNNQ